MCSGARLLKPSIQSLMCRDLRLSRRPRTVQCVLAQGLQTCDKRYMCSALGL
jgi:hypothetical protein